MPVDFFQRFDRRQRRVDPADERGRVDEAEIVGRECRKQAEADVGRRRPVCDPDVRYDLNVVGWKVVVLGAAECLEVPPRLERDGVQIIAVRRCQLGAPPRHGSAQRECDQRRDRPQRQHWQRDWQRARASDRDDNECGNGHYRTRGHRGEERADLRPPASGGVCRHRLPFQKSVTRDAETNEGHADRVQSLVGLIRHQRELKSAARGSRLDLISNLPDESRPRLLLVWTRQGFEAVEEDGHGQRCERRRGPYKRTSGKDGPTGYEQRDRCRRQEAASKVIENLPAGDQREPVALQPRAGRDEGP